MSQLHVYKYILTCIHTYIQGSNVTVCAFVVQESYLRNTYIHTHTTNILTYMGTCCMYVCMYVCMLLAFIPIFEYVLVMVP